MIHVTEEAGKARLRVAARRSRKACMGKKRAKRPSQVRVRTTTSRPHQSVPLLLNPHRKLERDCGARRGQRDFTDYERMDPYALRCCGLELQLFVVVGCEWCHGDVVAGAGGHSGERCWASDVDDAQAHGLVPLLAEHGTTGGRVESGGTKEIRVECKLISAVATAALLEGR